MSSVARTLAILTLPAAAIGAIAGLALRASSDPSSAPGGAAGGPVALETNGTTGGARTPTGGTRRADGSRPPRTPRAGGTRRVVGDDGSGATQLDPSYGTRLSSPDEETRLACALELLRMGSSRAQSVDRLATSSAAGGRLRDAVVNALTTLGQIEAGEDYKFLSDDARLGLELKYWGTVVPQSMLRDERMRYWAEQVSRDVERLAAGGVEPGEVAWHKLELGAVRRESGRIGDDAWTKLRAEQIDPFRNWAAEVQSRGRVDAKRLREIREALARFE